MILERAEEQESLVPVGYNDNIHSYDSALLGINDSGRLVYSKEKMVECLMNDSEMDYSEAWEFLEYNTFNAYLGVKTPIYINQYN